MSRSYKKNPFVTDNSQDKTFAKRQANKIFRRKIAKEKEMSSKPKFKKYSCSWNICDYKWRMTKKEAIEYWNSNSNNDYFIYHWPTLNEYIKMWNKNYYMK